MAACETTPNPYPNGPGFYETQVESNRLRISYLVPKNVSRDRAEDSLLMRAADDTLEKGFSWFRVIERARDVDTSQPRTSSSNGRMSARCAGPSPRPVAASIRSSCICPTTKIRAGDLSSSSHAERLFSPHLCGKVVNATSP